MANEIDGLLNPGAPTEANMSMPTGDIAPASAVEPQGPAPSPPQGVTQPQSTEYEPQAPSDSPVTPPAPMPRKLSVAPVVGQNPYADLLEQQSSAQAQALKGSMYVATKQNPDRAAEVLQIAQKTKLPVGVVERNFDQLKDTASRDQFDYGKILSDSPKTAQWMSDPKNAAIAHDDIPGLQKVEQTAQDHGTMMGLMNALGSGVAAFGSQLAKIPAADYELLQLPHNLAMHLRGEPDREYKAPDWLRNNPVAKYFDQISSDLQAREPLLQIDTQDAIAKGDYKRAALGITATAVQGAPQILGLIGASALAGPEAGAMLGPSLMGATMASGAAAESQAEGNDVTTSTLNAIGKGLVGAGGAHILTTGVLNRIGAQVTSQFGEQVARKVMSGVLTNIALATGVEGVNNTAMQFGNDFVDYVTGTKQSPFKNEGSKAAESFLVGGLTGGFLAAPGAYGAAHAQRMLARRAEFNAEFLSDLKNKIDQTKLFNRSKSASQDLTARALENGPAENTYIAPESVDTYFQSKKLDPLAEIQKAGLLKEYTEAKQSGRDMQINTADFTHNVESDHVKGLADDIKFDPNQLTVNEAKASQESVKTELTQISGEAKESSEETSRQDEADQMSKTIAAQLVQSGIYSRQVADQYAPLIAERMVQRSRLLGVSPKELAERENLRVMRADGEIMPSSNVYNQEQDGPRYGKFEVRDDMPEQVESLVLPESVLSEDRHASHQSAQEYARDNLRSQSIRNEHTRDDIGLPSDSFGKVKGSAPTRVALTHIDQLIRNAIWDGSESNEKQSKDDIKGFERYYANMVIGNTEYVVRLKARQTTQGLKFYHEVTVESERPRGNSDAVPSNEGRVQPAFIGPFKVNIHDFADQINATRKANTFFQKHLDPNGFEKIPATEAPLDRTTSQVAVEGEGETQTSDQSPSEGQRPTPSDPYEQEINSFSANVKEGSRQRLLLQEGSENSPRGSIELNAGQALIRLGRDADLSTVGHELGHLYLDQMGRDFAQISEIAEGERTAEQSQFLKDGEATLKYLGTDSFNAIEREHHETWARSFEAYLMEGKAPSSKLREVFGRFRTWLVGIYQNVKALGVELNPEIRQVMDRLVASQDAIDASEREMNVKPLFNDPRSIGMSEAQAHKYTEAVARAHQAATDELDRKIMRQYTREQQERYKQIKENVRTEIEKQVNQQPDQIALSVLQKGVLPDSTELPEGVGRPKLSKQMLVEQFGEGVLKDLPRPYVYSREGGIDPRAAAAQFGFESASDMIEALKESEKKADLLERLTDERMSQEHGDILTDGSMPEEALKAFHNEERSKLLHAELEHLVSNDLVVAKNVVRRMNRRAPDLTFVREQAEATVRGKLVRDTNPLLFQRAETKASREAEAAMLKGDMEKAFEAKQKELLNHELWRAATDAKAQADKTVDYMAKFKKASKIEQLGRTDYLDQINAIRSRFDFADVSQKELNRREKSLAEFIQKVQADGESAGEDVYISDELKNETLKTNYKNLTNDQLQGIRDTVKQLEHMAIQFDKLLSQKERIRKADAIQSLKGSIEANIVKGKPRAFTDSGKTAVDRVKSVLKTANASMIKMETVINWMDGGDINGAWHKLLWHPTVEAQNAENEYKVKITAMLAHAVDNLPKEIRNQLDDEVKVPGIDRILTRRDLLAVALNTGNESNYSKLREGHNWSDEQIKYMKDQLSHQEWKAVQGIWNTLESMWPDIARLQKSKTGLEPDKVKVTPVQTKYGTFEGGYYPLMYDAISSEQGQMQLSTKAGQLIESGYTRATTPKGHTKSRTQFVAPIDLDINRLPNHIAGVIKDLTHRNLVMDLNFIVNNREIRSAVADHLGEPYVKQMQDWARNLVNEANAPSTQAVGAARKAFNYFKTNSTMVTMGLKASTVLAHYVHAFVAAETVGGKEQDGSKWMLTGLSKVVRAPLESYQTMTEKSGEMKHYVGQIDRDVRGKIMNFSSDHRLIDKVREASMYGIHMAVMSMATTTWHAAYEKAIAQGHDEQHAVYSGDSAVRLALGSAATKDLPGILMKNDMLMQAMTMYFTPLAAFYNRQANFAHDAGDVLHTLKGQSWDQVPDTLKKRLPKLAVQSSLIYLMTGAFSAFLGGKKPGDDASTEDIAKYYAEHIALFPFMSIPGVKELASAIGGGYGAQMSPLEQVLKTTVDAAKTGEKYFAGEEELSKFAETTFKASGYYLGIPTTQMEITGQYLYEVAHGDEVPQSLGEFARRTLFKKPKDR